MQALLKAELDRGAFGLSSGLVYAPGSYSQTDEMIALAAVCARQGAVYTTHMRNEAGRMLEAVEEALLVARESGVRLSISHLKAQGRPNHGKVGRALELIDEAVAEGAAVYADAYPYDAASTTMTIVLPTWTLEQGVEGLLELLGREEGRQRVLEAFATGLPGWDNRSTMLGWENILIASLASEANRSLEGVSLEELGRRRGIPPGEALLDLLLEERGQVTALLRGMSEQDIRAALRHPRVMVCTDGLPVEGKPHPRLWGALTRYLGRYAPMGSDEEISRSLHKLTGLPARVYRLPGIGLLKPGYRADITLLEPERVMDAATYEDPTRLSEGIWRVYNGGQLTYAHKKATQARPGVFLSRPVKQG